MKKPILLLMLTTSTAIQAVELDFKPEVHSFVSFGYFGTTKNEWLGSSTSGSSEFWEAAANASITPLPTVRFAGQLFARDFQRADNGRAQLDWLYGEWRPADSIGLQAGRVKIPFGLYNEVRDVDAARATIFLPNSIYAQRSRDLYNSTDGAKAFGYLHLGPAGSVEYAAFVGRTHFSAAGGFASYLSDVGFGKISEVGLDYAWGGMLHWHTPVEGLAGRFTVTTLRGLYAYGTSGGMNLSASSEFSSNLVPSLSFERGPFTLATEALFALGSNEINFTDASGSVIAPPLVRDERGCGGYLSGSWHFPGDVDSTVSVERLWNDARNLEDVNTTRFSFAVRWGITEHWSVKAEYQRIIGPGAALAADNPDGVEDHWDLFALKTTVDF